jgi:hypothetical protein
MVATGFINSIMFGLMGMCRKNHILHNEQAGDYSGKVTIPQVMFCGTTVGANEWNTLH